MWTILLLVAAFVVWHFLPQETTYRPAPKFRRENRARASDPRWIVFFEEHCESPAEIAFLRTMIEAYNLRPDLGILYGKGLQLDLQVEEGRYRLDFLANQWLVIEIDGAAYHSTPEAIARDAQRDRCLEGLGYTVLRIPAKVVLEKPSEARCRVEAALQVGKRVVPAPVPKSGWQRLADTGSAITNAIAEINASIDEARAVQAALADAESAFHAEKTMIEAVIESAKIRLEIEDWLIASDDRMRSLYNENIAQFEKLFSDELNAENKVSSDDFPVAVFPDSLVIDGESRHTRAIQNSYANLVKTRSTFLLEQAGIMSADFRIPKIVKQELQGYGCDDYWQSLQNASETSAY